MHRNQASQRSDPDMFPLVSSAQFFCCSCCQRLPSFEGLKLAQAIRVGLSPHLWGHIKMTWPDGNICYVSLISLIFPDISNKKNSSDPPKNIRSASAGVTACCILNGQAEWVFRPKLCEICSTMTRCSWEGGISMSGSPLMKPLSFSKEAFSATVRTYPNTFFVGSSACQLL